MLATFTHTFTLCHTPRTSHTRTPIARMSTKRTSNSKWTGPPDSSHFQSFLLSSRRVTNFDHEYIPYTGDSPYLQTTYGSMMASRGEFVRHSYGPSKCRVSHHSSGWPGRNTASFDARPDRCVHGRWSHDAYDHAHEGGPEAEVTGAPVNRCVGQWGTYQLSPNLHFFPLVTLGFMLTIN